MHDLELDSFESQLKPTCQADMLAVTSIDKDDPNPDMPWASRLELVELIELARRKRIEHGLANPRRPGKDGWLGPVPASDRDPARTLLHNLFFHASVGACRCLDGMAQLMAGERLFWLSARSASTSFSVMIPCTRSSLD